jgi:hypothetical protein
MHEGFMQTTEGKRSPTTPENRQRNTFTAYALRDGKGKDRQAEVTAATQEPRQFWNRAPNPQSAGARLRKKPNGNAGASIEAKESRNKSASAVAHQEDFPTMLPDRRGSTRRCSKKVASPPAFRSIPAPHFFFVRGFADFAAAPPACTLSVAAPALSATGSHPGMPCRMRSAFLAGVMWP